METLRLTPHESVRIRRAEPELLEVEATYGPGKPPPPHFHPSQDERFEVLAGAINVEVDGETRELGAGEEIEIPRGSSHKLWNPSGEEARVVWQTMPAGRTEEWFRALDTLQRQGRVGRDGMPRLLDVAPLASEYRDVFRLAGPDVVLRPAIGLLAALGRMRRKV